MFDNDNKGLVDPVIKTKHLGKAHPIELRERIGRAMAYAALNKRRDFKKLAQVFQVDPKTARKYFRKMLADAEQQIFDYNIKEDADRSFLKPYARSKPRTKDVFMEETMKEAWESLSNALANLQTAHVPQYTAFDIVRILNDRSAAKEDLGVNPNAESTVLAFQKVRELADKLSGEKDFQFTEQHVKRAREDHKLSYKTIHYDYQEKDLEAVASAKKDFTDVQSLLFAEDCVFIDEFHTYMNLAPLRAWTKPGEKPNMRRKEQRASKTTVFAAMRWPEDEKGNLRVAFFLRIFPPVPVRISNQFPAKSPAEMNAVDLLRSQLWWEGLVTVVGSWCRIFDPVQNSSDIRLSRIREHMVRFFLQKTEFDFKAFIVRGNYSKFEIAYKTNARGAKVKKDSVPSDFWLRKEDDVVLDKKAFWEHSMFRTYWTFLPGKNNQSAYKSIGSMISNDSTLKDPEKQVEFVIRLAAHDFVWLEYIRRHNYSIGEESMGDSIAALGDDIHVPPGVTVKDETPILRLGDDSIKVVGMISRTNKDAVAAMLPCPDKSGTRDDDQNIQRGVFFMVEKLVDVFGDRSFAQILRDLYDHSKPSDNYKALDTFFSSDADDSYMFDREYVSRKERDIDQENSLPRAIYDALNIVWKVNDAQNRKTVMHGLDVATHIWFIVHHCKGDAKWMDGNLAELDSSPKLYGNPPQVDGSFTGWNFNKEAWSAFRKAVSFQRSKALPIRMSKNQLADKNAGAPALKVSKSLFRWFLQTLPDGFVHRKTIVMDGASIHGKPTDDEVQKNDLLKENAVFPEGELSEFATLLRAKGAGDGVLHPPTRKTYMNRRPALLFLPPYSPEYNPIELSFNTAKTFIRREAPKVPRTRLNLSYIIINAFHALIRAHAVKNYMLCSGYRSVQKNVVPAPIPPSDLRVLPPDTATDVLIAPRRGCMGRFVDGKYADPSEVRTRKASTSRPEMIRNYSEATPVVDNYPGKEYRTGFDFRVPVTRSCIRTTEGESGARGIEIEKRTEPVESQNVVTRCKQRPASAFAQGEKVLVLPLGKRMWINGTIERAPGPRSSQHNPWLSVRLEGSADPVWVTVNRVRPTPETRQEQEDAANKRWEESEKRRKQMIRMRDAERKRQAENMETFRDQVFGRPGFETYKERAKIVRAIVKNASDPVAKAREKRAVPITKDELVRVPSVYSNILTV